MFLSGNPYRHGLFSKGGQGLVADSNTVFKSISKHWHGAPLWSGRSAWKSWKRYEWGFQHLCLARPWQFFTVELNYAGNGSDEHDLYDEGRVNSSHLQEQGHELQYI